MIKTVVATLGASAVGAIVALLTSVLTARGLGVEGRGALASALLIISMARMTGQLGLGNAFVLEVRARQSTQFWRLAAHGLATSTIVGSCVALVLASTTLLAHRPAYLLGAIVASAAVGAINEFMLTSMQVQSSLKYFNAGRLLAPTVGVLLILGLFMNGALTVTSTIASLAAGGVVLCVAGLAAMSRIANDMRPRESSRTTPLKRFWRSGMSYFGITIVNFAIVNAHLFIMALFASLEQFGLYAAAFGLSRLIAPIQQALGYALYASGPGASDDGRDVFAKTATVVRLTTLPLLCAVALSVLASPLLVPGLLGTAFTAATLSFCLLTLEAVLSGTTTLLSQPYQAIGSTRAVLRRNCISLLPLAAAAPVVTNNGAVGMSYLLLISALLRMALIYHLYLRERKFAIRFIPYGPELRGLAQATRRGRAPKRSH